MKHIYLNLKRFDVPPQLGGVNRLADLSGWGGQIVRATEDALRAYDTAQTEFVMYFPEAHLLNAAAARTPHSPVKLGCQGVHRADTAPGGNFGAFTTARPAGVMREIGCESTLIGHCEERVEKAGILAEAGVQDTAAINRILNAEVLAAQKAGLSVLYCIGETQQEQPVWETVLEEQLSIGLANADLSRVAIAYEPVWSIGPGKTPADRDYITKIARFIHAEVPGVPVVYGGGLKLENAAMLASIEEIDGGLIALTRFSGEIGFYPEEYLEIIRAYLSI